MDILTKVENVYILQGKISEDGKGSLCSKMYHQWDVLFLNLWGKEQTLSYFLSIIW